MIFSPHPAKYISVIFNNISLSLSPALQLGWGMQVPCAEFPISPAEGARGNLYVLSKRYQSPRIPLWASEPSALAFRES